MNFDPSRQASDSVSVFHSVAAFLQRDIPIFIAAFENPTYVRGMVDQLRAFGLRNIVVVDNASETPEMVALLESDFGAEVVRLPHNRGPRHVFIDDDAFALLPDLFCLTDPDLVLNSDLPPDFIGKLASLTERFQIGKAGFSIDISEPEAMKSEPFSMGGVMYTITEWEKRFWENPVGDLDGLGPIYRATIDTTFAVYNKKYFSREWFMDAVRVAGVFTCKHLPWYLDTGLPQDEEAAYRARARTSFYLADTAPVELR